MELMIITALFVIALIWGIFFYITGIRKDRKILNKYLANKHKQINRLKSSTNLRKAVASSE